MFDILNENQQEGYFNFPSTRPESAKSRPKSAQSAATTTAIREYKNK